MPIELDVSCGNWLLLWVDGGEAFSSGGALAQNLGPISNPTTTQLKAMHLIVISKTTEIG
jgi:hypothetical protein